MSGLPAACGFTQPDADETKAHFIAYTTPRSTANTLLFDIWNAATNAGREWCVDLNGKMYSGALTAGDVLYAVAGSVTGVKRLDSLGIGAANTVMTSSGTAPQWVSTLAGLTSVTSTAFVGALTGNVTGNADTATALATARAINGVDFNGTAAITVTAAAGTLTGATLASGVTASSLTSVGTLTSLTVSGALGCGALTATTGTFSGLLKSENATGTTIQASNTSGGYAKLVVSSNATSVASIEYTNSLAFTGGPVTMGALSATTGTFSGAVSGITTLTATTLAGTLSTAAQPNITSLGTLTALQVDNLNLNGNTLSATSGVLLIPGFTKTLYTNVTTSPTTGTVKENLMSYSVPANTLSTNGMGLRGVISGLFAANANSKTIGFGFQNDISSSGGSSNNTGWRYEIYLMRRSDTLVVWQAIKTDGLTVFNTQTGVTAVSSLAANALSFYVYGTTPTQAGDITADIMVVELINP